MMLAPRRSVAAVAVSAASSALKRLASSATPSRPPPSTAAEVAGARIDKACAFVSEALQAGVSADGADHDRWSADEVAGAAEGLRLMATVLETCRRDAAPADGKGDGVHGGVALPCTLALVAACDARSRVLQRHRSLRQGVDAVLRAVPAEVAARLAVVRGLIFARALRRSCDGNTLAPRAVAVSAGYLRGLAECLGGDAAASVTGVGGKLWRATVRTAARNGQAATLPATATAAGPSPALLLHGAAAEAFGTLEQATEVLAGGGGGNGGNRRSGHLAALLCCGVHVLGGSLRDVYEACGVRHAVRLHGGDAVLVQHVLLLHHAAARAAGGGIPEPPALVASMLFGARGGGGGGSRTSWADTVALLSLSRDAGVLVRRAATREGGLVQALQGYCAQRVRGLAAEAEAAGDGGKARLWDELVQLHAVSLRCGFPAAWQCTALLEDAVADDAWLDGRPEALLQAVRCGGAMLACVERWLDRRCGERLQPTVVLGNRSLAEVADAYSRASEVTLRLFSLIRASYNWRRRGVESVRSRLVEAFVRASVSYI